MTRDARIRLSVGCFTLVALLTAAVAVLSLSSQSGVWRPRYHLVTYFENVEGLLGGAPVRLAGKEIGQVETVEFVAPVGAARPIRAQLSLDRDVQARIRSDSRARIANLGPLGDKYVEISLSSGAGEVLADGAELATENRFGLVELLDRGAVALDDVATLARNVNSVLGRFSDQMGAVRIAETAGSVADLLEEIRSGDGLLHKLIYDPHLGGEIAGINRSLAALEAILDEIATGEGLLHAMIFPSPEERGATADLLEAASRLNAILRRIEAGEGTLGLLLADPTLYEEIKLLVGGARRSLVVRTLIGLFGESEADGS